MCVPKMNLHLTFYMTQAEIYATLLYYICLPGIFKFMKMNWFFCFRCWLLNFVVLKVLKHTTSTKYHYCQNSKSNYKTNGRKAILCVCEFCVMQYAAIFPVLRLRFQSKEYRNNSISNEKACFTESSQFEESRKAKNTKHQMVHGIHCR